MRQGCEVVECWNPMRFCGAPATWRYPAMGGGHMYLCEPHAQRHLTPPEPEAIGMERASGGWPAIAEVPRG